SGVQAFRRSGVQALGKSDPSERPNARTPERLTSVELRPHDDAPGGPAAIDAAREGAGDLQAIPTRAELVDGHRLSGAPLRLLGTRILEPERQMSLAAADPEQTRHFAPMLHAVIAQLAGREHGAARVVDPCRLGQVAHPFSRRADVFKTG